MNTLHNPIQLAWIEANVQLNKAEDTRKKAEKDYIRLHSLKNADGSIPKHLDDLQLDDQALIDARIEDFWSLNEELGNLLEKRRREYREAEKALIQWGIEQLCKENRGDIAQAIQNGMGIWVYRDKALRLFFNWNIAFDEHGLIAYDSPAGDAA